MPTPLPPLTAVNFSSDDSAMACNWIAMSGWMLNKWRLRARQLRAPTRDTDAADAPLWGADSSLNLSVMLMAPPSQCSIQQ